MISQTVSPLDISGLLRDAEGDCVSRRLLVAARFLAAATCEQVLESFCSQESEAWRLRRLTGEVDHVGFLAPIEAERTVAAAAAAAGFELDQRSFPSTILTRELGGLLGRDVPTTIFKARLTGSPGAPTSVEVAMPQNVDAGLVGEWIGEGIGAHIALRLADASHFAEVTRIMSREGFEVPAFMRGGPVANEGEGIWAVYFSHPARNASLRLEFLCQC